MLERAGFLEWRPDLPQADFHRRLFVTGDIFDLMAGIDPASPFPAADAQRVAKRFVAGHAQFISRKINSKRANLELLEDIDELWTICVRVPPPGWRLFGRFLQQDVLIVLRAEDRNKLGAIPQFAAAANMLAQEIADEWRRRLPGLDPLRSHRIEDYLTGVWRDLDAQE